MEIHYNRVEYLYNALHILSANRIISSLRVLKNYLTSKPSIGWIILDGWTIQEIAPSASYQLLEVEQLRPKTFTKT